MRFIKVGIYLSFFKYIIQSEKTLFLRSLKKSNSFPMDINEMHLK